MSRPASSQLGLFAVRAEPPPPPAPAIVDRDPEPDTCATCGCTDEEPCRDEAGQVACSWARRDAASCSLCEAKARRDLKPANVFLVPRVPPMPPGDPWGLAPDGVDPDDGGELPEAFDPLEEPDTGQAEEPTW